MIAPLPFVEASEPRVVRSTHWGRFIPYFVLISVFAMVFAFSNPTPEPVVENPIPHAPALDESEGQKLRGGFWIVEEMWLGSKLEFSAQAEWGRLSTEADRLDRGETPRIVLFSNRLARISSSHTLEVASRLVHVTNMMTDGPWLTDMVFITRFDPEGMGTVNALPIAWNEEKEDVLKKLDAGESLKGLYSFNGGTMQVYLPGDTSMPRPTSIPKALNPADRLFTLNRYEERDERSLSFSYPPNWDDSYYGKTEKLNSDGTLAYHIIDGNPREGQVEMIPVPLTTPIEQAVDPPRTKRTFTFCHTNGWIVQTEPPPDPEPEPLPNNAPHPALQWIRDQAKKLK